MFQRLRYYLLTLSFLFLTYKSYGQVELSALVGPAFNYASVNHAPDSAGTSTVKSGLNGGIAATLEANLPMQHGFRLKAGIRLLYKNMSFKQDYELPWATFKNHWILEGFALETPVHLTYPVVDRRFQITFGAGIAVVKNWLNAGPTGISGYNNSVNGTTINSYYGDLVTSSYQAKKNNISLAGELSIEIIPTFFSHLSLGIIGHQDLLKNIGRLTYENRYGVQTGSSPLFRSKGSFGIERPGYFMIQLKYTFAGKPKETEITDFENDGSE